MSLLALVVSRLFGGIVEPVSGSIGVGGGIAGTPFSISSLNLRLDPKGLTVPPPTEPASQVQGPIPVFRSPVDHSSSQGGR